MADKDKFAIWLLRVTGLFLSFSVVVAILSILPEDDNPFDGFAVMFMFFGWVAICVVCSIFGLVAAKFTKLSARVVPSVVWCALAIFALWFSNQDHELNNPQNIIWWVVGALICSAPLVAGWAWAKKIQLVSESNVVKIANLNPTASPHGGGKSKN